MVVRERHHSWRSNGMRTKYFARVPVPWLLQSRGEGSLGHDFQDMQASVWTIQGSSIGLAGMRLSTSPLDAFGWGR